MKAGFTAGLALFIGVALFIGACDILLQNGGRGCTEIGCTSGYTLTLQPSRTRFAEGRYDVRLTPEGDSTRSCFFAVSDNPDECASGHCVNAEDCNAIYFVGYPDPDRIHILYPTLDSALSVSVEREGVVVSDTLFQPTYEILQPNGPECPPTCRVAGDSLVID